MKDKKGQIGSSHRPPIVAVLGHVDHGKTTLLDYIRHTNVASREHGGITQHIGAYQINIKNQISNIKNNDNAIITFIDTPGHEAFMKMRSRGARVADIAVLVVAADDSVKPQTKESIRIIKDASIPVIVAVNKIDLPSANAEIVKQDLARSDVQVEGFGGDVPVVLLSAKTGKGVDELLEKITALSHTLNLVNQPNLPLEAVVIETRLDKGKGMVASCIVKAGTLRGGMSLFEDSLQVAKVRALFDEQGVGVKDALPGKPVEILGFTTLPHIGSLLHGEPQQEGTEQSIQPEEKKQQGEMDFLSFAPREKTLHIILKADTAGSLEAICASLKKGATLVEKGIGEINEADVLLAKSTGSFIIGFNIKRKRDVEKFAETEGIVLRNYTVIYELLDEVNDAISGMQEVLTKERELGKGAIIAEFPYDGKRVAGVKVTEGRLARGDQVKIMRHGEEAGRAKIKSIRKGKEETTKAESGIECGILFDGKVDFELQDAIIAFIRS